MNHRDTENTEERHAASGPGYGSHPLGFAREPQEAIAKTRWRGRAPKVRSVKGLERW